MEIKLGTINEAEAIGYMFDDYRQCYEQPSDYHACLAFVTDRLTNKDSYFLVVFDTDENIACGFVQIYPSFSSISMKKIFILNDLYVSPEYRKQGIAKDLINKAKDFAKEQNAGQIVIETRISNSSASKLYDSVGFAKEGEHLYYFLET